MILPAAPWQKRGGMAQLLAALDAGNGQTRYVGGCVRDTLLGVASSDIDLATRLEPDDVMHRLRRAKIKVVPTGLAHGTVTAVLADGPVEITTLRRDVSTDGRRATIAFTEDWQADAARRDFTINALSADPETGEIFDYFGGLEDLEKGQVRFIGEPLQRIAEDYLRILRFFRFHARFGKGEPDGKALAACAARANDLMALSRERIADELLKLLALPEPVAAIASMIEHHILTPVIPEIHDQAAAGLGRLVVREQSLGIEPNALRRLAALLPADPAIAAAIAARLRLSKKAAKRLTAVAGRSETAATDPKALAYRIGMEEAVDRLLLAEDESLAAKSRHLDGWQKPVLPLGGGDLIAMGLKPGPAISATLQAIEADWIGEGFPQDEETVARLARRHVDQLLRASQ